MKSSGILSMSKGVGIREDINFSFGKISSSSESEGVMKGPDLITALTLSVFESKLPRDLKITTFHYLRLSDLYNLMRTSKKYYKLARDNEVWKNRFIDCVSRSEKMKNMNIKKENNPFYWFQVTQYFCKTSRYGVYPPKVVFSPKPNENSKDYDEMKKMIEFHYPFYGQKVVIYIVVITENYIRLYDSKNRNLAKEVFINDKKYTSDSNDKEKLYNTYQFSDWYLLTFSHVNNNHRIRVWDLRTMECSRILVPEKEEERVTKEYVFFSRLKSKNDDLKLLACSRDHFVGIWKILDGALEYTFRGKQKKFLGYHFLSDHTKLLIGVEESKKRGGTSIMDIMNDDDDDDEDQGSKNKQKVVNHVNVFDLRSKEFYSKLLVNSKKPITLFAELEGKYPQKIVLVKDNGSLPKMQVWNVAGSRVYEMRGANSHKGKIMGLMYMERKELLFSISKDLEIRVWNMKRYYKCIKVMKYPTRPMIKIFEMRNRRICTVSSKGDWKILVWDSSKGVCEAVLDPKISEPEKGRLISVIELPSGKICSLCTEGRISIWDWEYDASYNTSSWSFD